MTSILNETKFACRPAASVRQFLLGSQGNDARGWTHVRSFPGLLTGFRGDSCLCSSRLACGCVKTCGAVPANILGRERWARDHAAVNGTRSVRCRVETLALNFNLSETCRWAVPHYQQRLVRMESVLTQPVRPENKGMFTQCWAGMDVLLWTRPFFRKMLHLRVAWALAGAAVGFFLLFLIQAHFFGEGKP